MDHVSVADRECRTERTLHTPRNSVAPGLACQSQSAELPAPPDSGIIATINMSKSKTGRALLSDPNLSAGSGPNLSFSPDLKD